VLSPAFSGARDTMLELSRLVQLELAPGHLVSVQATGLCISEGSHTGKVFQFSVKVSVATASGLVSSSHILGVVMIVCLQTVRWTVGLSVNRIGENIHFDLSDHVLDSSFAMVFRTPELGGECSSSFTTDKGLLLVTIT